MTERAAPGSVSDMVVFFCINPNTISAESVPGTRRRRRKFTWKRLYFNPVLTTKRIFPEFTSTKVRARYSSPHRLQCPDRKIYIFLEKKIVKDILFWHFVFAFKFTHRTVRSNGITVHWRCTVLQILSSKCTFVWINEMRLFFSWRRT